MRLYFAPGLKHPAELQLVSWRTRTCLWSFLIDSSGFLTLASAEDGMSASAFLFLLVSP